jgi:gliding motility-associated-like protein
MTRFLEINSLKRLVLVGILLIISNFSFSQILFQESFDEGDDAVNGTDDLGSGVTWTSICPDCLPSGNPAGADDFYKILSGELKAQDSNGPATFETTDIDISSCTGNIEVAFDVSESGPMEDCGTGCNSADWVQFQYSIDGGAWQEPSNSYFCLGPCADNNVILSGDLTGIVNYNSGCLGSGNTIKIRIIVQCWAADEIWAIDNVTVTCVPQNTPTFNPVAPICSGASLSPLPTTSTNGITGTWSPAIDNTITTLYSFTPDAGQCADPVDLTITVNPSSSHAVNVNLCSGDNYTYEDGTVSNNVMANESHVSTLIAANGCDSLLTENLIVNTSNSTTINYSFCIGADFTYADGTVSTNMQTSESHVSTYSNAGGCDSVVTENITIGSTLAITLTTAEPLCFNQTNGSVSINVGVGGIDPGAIFTITDSDSTVLNQGNSNAAEFLGTGWYYCYVDNPSGCDGMDSVFLDQPDSMYFLLNTSDPLCTGGSDGGAWLVNILNNQGPFTIAWNSVVTGLDTNMTLPAGNNTAVLVDSVGCTAQVDFILDNPPSIEIGVLTGDPSQCRGDSFYPGSGTVSATATGGSGTLNYQWVGNGDTSITNTWGNRTPGWYVLTVTDDNGCTVLDSIFVDSLNPIADFTVNPDFGYTPLTVTITDNSDNRVINTWNINDTIQNSIVVGFNDQQMAFDSVFVEEGIHAVCLIVSNDFECYDTLCLNIQVNPEVEIELPNVITPNGDGVNDIWNPFENIGLEEITCTILNRWGNEVFVINDVNTSFTGKDKKGKDLTDGVYSVVYTGRGYDGVYYKGTGFIQLIK